MKESNYDSYCGLYCGACDILRCYEKGHESKFASLWTEPTLKAFLKSQGATYSGDDDLKLKCQGCKSDDVFIVCRSCKIRECALSKNFEHCSDCSDFPCEIYNDWKKVQIFLPHINGTQGNLDVLVKWELINGYQIKKINGNALNAIQIFHGIHLTAIIADMI